MAFQLLIETYPILPDRAPFEKKSKKNDFFNRRIYFDYFYITIVLR